MERYRNRHGDSGVVGFEDDLQGLTVLFDDGHVYLYTNLQPGHHDLQEMRRCAHRGWGLNAYINRHVRRRYARRLR